MASATMSPYVTRVQITVSRSMLTVIQTEGYYYTPTMFNGDPTPDPFATASAPPAVETPFPPVADTFLDVGLASSSTRLSLPPTEYDIGSLHGSLAPSPLSTMSAGNGAVPVKRKRGRPPKNRDAQLNGGGSQTPKPKANGKAVAKEAPSARQPNGQPAVAREEICGFCRLPDYKNENGAKEKLVSCTMCGRSGHPICLGFTDPQIKKKIMSYSWCCIECKPCETCRQQGDDVSRCRAISS